MSQLSLFEAPEKPKDVCQQAARPKAPVKFWDQAFSANRSSALFEASLELDWSQNQITMRGQTYNLPRRECIFGDKQYTYKYSGGRVQYKARPWPPFLEQLRDDIEKKTGFKFPLCIGNRYDSGKDGIGPHDDGRDELGDRPAIASVSLGATRRFKLYWKEDKSHVFDYDLGHGSLVVMLPGCQEAWKHALPKTSREVGTRINWTFRPWCGGDAPEHDDLKVPF